jgi:hypothetical protein
VIGQNQRNTGAKFAAATFKDRKKEFSPIKQITEHRNRSLNYQDCEDIVVFEVLRILIGQQGLPHYWATMDLAHIERQQPGWNSRIMVYLNP